MTKEQLCRKYVWWSAEISDDRLLAQLMEFADFEDTLAMRGLWSDDDLRSILKSPPPGVFTKRSWSYWHKMLGFSTVPPIPERHIPA